MTFRPICSGFAGLQSQRAAPPKLRRVNFNQRRAGSLWQCITLNEAKRELSFSRAPATNGPRCYKDNLVSPLLFARDALFFLYLSLLFQDSSCCFVGDVTYAVHSATVRCFCPSYVFVGTLYRPVLYVFVHFKIFALAEAGHISALRCSYGVFFFFGNSFAA